MTKTKATSTNTLNRNFLVDCNLTYALLIISGRWKLLILMRLDKGIKRFGELKKNIPNITEKMLTVQLRELEKAELISRYVYAEVPLRVEYNLTEIGRELIPVCKDLHKWGAKHKLMQQNKETSLPL